MNENIQISEERLAEFREAFELFQEGVSSETVSLQKIIEVFSELGHEITIDDLKNYFRELRTDGHRVNMNDFIKIVAHKTKDNMVEEEVIEAFKVFDKKGDGKIHWEEIKNVLKGNIGEDVSDEDLIEIIQSASNDGEYILYNELVKNNVNK